MHTTQLQSMSLPPDIIVETPGRRTILMVECAFQPNASAADVARQRNRLLSDGYLDVPSDSFFMLVVPSRFHLWNPRTATDALPDGSADAMPVLRDYLGKGAKESSWPWAEPTELAVSAWLRDLAASRRSADESEADQMLASAGVCDLIKHCAVRREISR
jgi:hypothetical protein